jgi:phenylalanyl-tRNA synthetase alpha chain
MSDDSVADLEEYQREALSGLVPAKDEKELEAWYRKHLAPSGVMNQWRKRIGSLPPERRKEFGARVNTVSNALKESFEGQKRVVADLELARTIQAERVDVTLPARSLVTGGYHPLTTAIREVERVFHEMGFRPSSRRTRSSTNTTSSS